MNPLFGLFGRDAAARILSGDLAVTDFYNRLYVTVALIALAILGVSFAGDVAGHNWVNIVIIPIWVLAVLWIKFYPRAIESVLAISTIASKVGAITSIKDGYEKWDLFTKHAMLFGGVFGLTRFLVPIKAYPFMGLLLLGALITLGIYTWVWPTGKAYKRYVLGIVLVAVAIGLFGTTITGKSTSDGLHGLKNELSGYTKTFEVEVSNFKDQEICDVRVDEGMRYKIPREVYVILASGTESIVTSYIRVNNTVPGEKFTVDGNGCVKLHFSYTREFREKTVISAQMIPITFYK